LWRAILIDWAWSLIITEGRWIHMIDRSRRIPRIREQHVMGKVASISEKRDGKVGGVLKGFKNWSP